MKKTSDKKETSERREENRSLERRSSELDPWRSLLGDWPFAGRLARPWDELLQANPWAGRPGAGGLVPAMDVSENDEHYAISVELPGARKEDVHVELHEGVLTVRGEKTSEREEKKERSRYVERCYGSFSRSLRLPPDANPERLDASFKDGVLSITIPKTEEPKPRTIAIKAG
jgi:HSP20 family protein